MCPQAEGSTASRVQADNAAGHERNDSNPPAGGKQKPMAGNGRGRPRAVWLTRNSRARKRNAPREGGGWVSSRESTTGTGSHAIAAQVGHEISARFRRGLRWSLRPSLPRNAVADGAESASTRASAQSNHLGIADKERSTVINGARTYSLANERRVYKCRGLGGN